MSGSIHLELPEDLLVEALRRLPAARRRELAAILETEEGGVRRAVPAAELARLTGACAIGGDAFEDAERLYDDASNA